MSTTSTRILLTDRDHEILGAFDRCPLTVGQLLKVSATFGQAFTSESRVRGRLAMLHRAGFVQRWQYATVRRGSAPDYYKLTLAGYRLLAGEDAQPPTKRAFSEVGLAKQHHTRSLADFIVHTVVAAHARGMPLVDFARENSLKLEIGAECLFPDCAFQLRLPDEKLNFVVELDNGTERVRSQKDADSWERKIRLYDAYQDGAGHRFRVLVVSTRSRERLDHILDAAATLQRNPRRTLFCGVHLDDYLTLEDAVGAACFLDHRGHRISLVPALQLPLGPTSPARGLAPVAAVG